MSDVFEGPGYWMASDGKWYPPERHPDSGYRERFAAVPPPVPQAEEMKPPSVPDTDGVTNTQTETKTQAPAASEFPSVELHHEETPAASTPLADLHRTSGDSSAPEAGEDRVALGTDELSEVVESIEREQPVAKDASGAPSFSVASKDFGSVPDRPVFEKSTPPSVTSPGTKTPSSHIEVGHGTVELEIDRTPASPSRQTPLRSASGVPLSASTALAVIPTPQPVPVAALFDRLLAALLFCAGVAMIVGTFFDWTTGSLIQTGWERGDGIATIIAGIFGAAAAGPIYVGYNHIVPKTVAVVAGLVGLVVVGLTGASVLFDSDVADTSLATGFFVVSVGALAMLAGGIAHRIDPLY